MEIFSSILIGVLAGAITSSLIYLIQLFYRKIFIPWYEDRQYKGVILDGKWEASKRRTIITDKKSGRKELPLDELKMLLEIEQKGYKIFGIFQAKSIDHLGKEDYENFYKITGQIRDNYVVLEYFPVSRKRTGLGSFVLQVIEGGKKLKGSVSFVEEGEMGIESIEDVNFKRKED